MTLDKRFKVTTITRTPNPQRLIYAAMHQDYSSDPVDELPNITEEKAGEIIISRLLGRTIGHYGCLEHPQITLSCSYFPHSVMQQARTHRVGITFDCQSFRYTGKHLTKVSNGEVDVEDVIYLRPEGEYRNRAGKRFTYTHKQRQEDINDSLRALKKYNQRFIWDGFAEEHLRGQVPFDYRQHFIVSFNVRSLMHFLDLRNKKDAQLEIQELSKLMLLNFEDWCPQLYHWYVNDHKVILAP